MGTEADTCRNLITPKLQASGRENGPNSIALQRSSQRWHEGKHDLTPWLNSFLAIIRGACEEFEQRAGQIKSPRSSKTTFVLDAIQRQTSEFSVADMQKECPGVSLDMIRHLLKQLRGKEVACLRRGHQARWRRKSNR